MEATETSQQRASYKDIVPHEPHIPIIIINKGKFLVSHKEESSSIKTRTAYSLRSCLQKYGIMVHGKKTTPHTEDTVLRHYFESILGDTVKIDSCLTEAAKSEKKRYCGRRLMLKHFIPKVQDEFFQYIYDKYSPNLEESKQANFYHDLRTWFVRSKNKKISKHTCKARKKSTEVSAASLQPLE